MRRTVLLLALASTLVPACKGKDNTKIVVAVWGDLPVPAEMNSIRIDVAGTGSKNFPLTAGSDPSAALAQLELVPLGAKNETFTVTATGLYGLTDLVAQTARVSFVPGQSLLLKLFLAGACERVPCTGDYTCAAGSCNQDIAIPNLPPYDPSVPLSPPDAGTVLDSGSGAVDSGTGGVAGSDARPIDASVADAIDAPLGGASGAGGSGGTGGSAGTGGSGGSTGGTGATVASGGVVGIGGIVGTGGVGAGGAVATGDWAEWPMPNDQVDVTAGAPNLESYTDNHDGTVTDNVTGLMWQQAVSTTTYYTWAQAVAYCPTLTLASHSDWRLPSRIELVSIVDLGVTSGATINATYFPSTPADWFWSSSPSAGSSSLAWSVLFDGGRMGFSDVSGPFLVRCVR
jgi:hypothetical protein